MIIVGLLYGWIVFVAGTNLLLMRRPRERGPLCFEVLIPARNEEENLKRVIPPLILGGAKVTVYDDDSSDETARLAAELGASVIRGTSLPIGWTGKNRACHELALAANAEWALFLDADTIPTEDFVPLLSGFLRAQSPKVSLVSGFPRMLTGKGVEPLYLGWVPWILLGTNPFGLVSRTGRGHNRFTNGQFDAWRINVLQEVAPFERMKSEVLEDVKIGRLMAKLGQRVEIANVSAILSVRMYNTIGEAIDGMSKNSADIARTPFGTVLLALFMLFLGWGWLLGRHEWWAFFLALVAGKALTDRSIRYPVVTALFMPLTCTLAAATFFRALSWKRKGRVTWKGRTYPS